VKSVDTITVTRAADRVSVFVEARSFLHHQVRSIVGALTVVGQGKWMPDDVSAALDARDRQALPLNAPPDGLWFVGADYPSG
jgi:tRNA pseudouridine38-40 synthase